MIEQEFLEEYINRYNKKFSYPGDGYSLSYEFVDIDQAGLNKNKQKIADNIINECKTRDENLTKQHYGIYLSYGISLAVMELKGCSECITFQGGFREEAVISENLDEILNIETHVENPRAFISNILSWCINPESNIEISDDIWKSLLFQSIKKISRIVLPGKSPEITIVVPYISKELDYPDWKDMFSTLKIKNYNFTLLDYGHVCGVEKNERKYIVQYQTDGKREYVLVAAYERIRGKISCLGILAFDVEKNDTQYEMKCVKETSFDVNWNPQKYKKEETSEIVSDCHMNDSHFQAGSGFNSFLGSHAISFAKEKYRPKDEISSEYQDLFEVFREGEALQVVEICSRLIKVKDMYNISLEDVVAIANRLEHAKCFEKTGVSTKYQAKLGTYKGIAKNIDLPKLRKIPANYATITWKLRNKRKKTIPYEKLELGRYSDKEIIESIVQYYDHATTENIAEDLLYLAVKFVNVDPSAFFAAKIFLVLLSMDSLMIDSRHEEIKSISNVDLEVYTPIEMPKTISKKKTTKSYGAKSHVNVFQNKEQQKIMKKQIDELGLSVRTYNCLKKVRIDTIEDLCEIAKTPKKLMKVRNLGRNNYLEIYEKLNEWGLEHYICVSK